MNPGHPSRDLQPTYRCDVLLAVDAYLPWSGGSRIYYDNLYRRMAGQFGLSVNVETSHCSGDVLFDETSSSDLLKIHRNGERLTDWKMHRAPVLARKVMRIARAAQDCAPAAVHCGDLFPQDFAGMLLRKLRRTPLLVFVHGDEISQTQGRRLQPRLRDAIYHSADFIVAANRYAYDRVIDILGSSDRVAMITPGVDYELFYPGARPEWISRDFGIGSSPLLVTVGRLVKKKGHETVLRSLPEVKRTFPDVQYLIVGDGPERSRLQNLVMDLGLASCVRFSGDIPNHKLGDFYRAADIFCLVNQQDPTGDIESFGMVFIEAGASGKPVVGGRSGGTTQSVLDGQTGILCEPGNSSQLSDLLSLLLSSYELRRRMGDAGLKRAQLEFDWDRRAAQLLDAHKSIIHPQALRIGGIPLCSPR